MLNKLHLGVSCSVVGCELRVNESKNVVHLEKERKFASLYLRLLQKVLK